MNLDAALRLAGIAWLCWWAIKGIVWGVERSARRPRRIGRKNWNRGDADWNWNRGDADWLSMHLIDPTPVADDPRRGGAS